jgi:predicted GTPase
MDFAKYLKAFGGKTQIALVFNKCDGQYDEGEVIAESVKLGLGIPFSTSAKEGTGVI